MKHLLVPVDFSKVSYLGTDTAVKLAGKLGACLVFFTQLPGKASGEVFEIEETDLEAAPFFLKTEYKKLMDRYAGQSFARRFFYSTGSFLPSLKQLTNEVSIDLIVMGSSGAEGFKEIFGSTAQKLVNQLPIPIMVVKHPLQNYDFKHIVFASNFAYEARKPFERLVHFASYFGSHIHLLFVETPDTDRIDEYLARKKMKVFESICWRLPITMHFEGDVDVENGIKMFARNHQIDLVAMLSHGEGFWKKLAKGGSITEAVVKHLEEPVLTLPMQEKKRQTNPGEEKSEIRR